MPPHNAYIHKKNSGQIYKNLMDVFGISMESKKIALYTLQFGELFKSNESHCFHNKSKFKLKNLKNSGCGKSLTIMLLEWGKEGRFLVILCLSEL